ncbi:sodium ion-translocating decarboxylase subunit beta [Salmonella enterica subsp. enterica serovar Javiana]|nr:sodium ion-translocating decarboxylase subunit beta [Salmonella enterica subsp. enterica serovar Javiana]
MMSRARNLSGKNRINPLTGSAGLATVPMGARLTIRVGLESDPRRILRMLAMGPSVAGVIGSAIAAGVMLKYVLAM